MSPTTPATAVRVALVDDQALFRAGIKMLVSSQPDLEFVGEASNGEEGVAMVAATRPDVVLMDIRMPVMDGIAATTAVLAQAQAASRKPPRVIVLTTFDLDEAATRAIRGGASGFVLKDADPEFLLAAIRTVHAGNAVIAASATRELFEHFDGRSARAAAVPAAFGTLTTRERDIFDLAARGLSNSEIAGREYLSEATVKTHISRVLSKLSLRDRVQLVVYAYEHGLAE
ncbi:DNA-binding NarL/FixJ family response regulator [Frigoribacterium sp. PvP120]|jgi:DNA-binding NarL/FixJ family response regulator|uniref:response regulator n=1 Tax=Frigoribacterium TaxID=96492 RepID=UPI0006F65F7D|nr:MULTISPECIES: response regulator transcription factor [Frigoribacterium]KQR46795.1 LuxR family transcriptional regulator [Frigoribacterium sp. Leaf164]MBD8659347.1 response regulator transcription factor [Frigoribacterium sp. CFBP 8754]MBD8727642.1 response regulator transcription factor [Frigoribacterium sp. CFBP 13707]MBP1241650.1 DNA-binding NarL/FixJ family response regulator [Frigoribacterium sp. PvP121]NII50529.1 DNA-binding NarL/FixJ family response regulator [Frigoribacterium endoph